VVVVSHLRLLSKGSKVAVTLLLLTD